MATDINLSNENVDVNNVLCNSTVTASLFEGDGSQLTNITVSNIDTLCALAYLSADSTVNNSANVFVQKNVFPSTTTGLSINNGGFTSSTSGIVVPESGVYIVGANARFSSAASRSAVAMTFTLNSSPLTNEFQSVASYIRNASNHNDSSTPLTGVLELTTGDEVGLAFAQYAASGTVNLVSTGSDTSHFFMYRIS